MTVDAWYKQWISIHAPRVGCDEHDPIAWAVDSRFQSTHPVWGATLASFLPPGSSCGFQSTHPVWGATPGHMGGLSRERISIHAPRVGCDLGGFA